MQVEAIPMLINGDFLNAPLDVKMHLADYKMYGEDSYVFQQKELLHGLYECTYLSMNDRRINGEAFEYLTANNKHIGKALSNVYDIEQKEELSTLTTMQAVAASSTAMQAVLASSIAMQAVAASSTAMQTVLTSSTAIAEILSSSNHNEEMFTIMGKSKAVLNTFKNSVTLMIKFNKLSEELRAKFANGVEKKNINSEYYTSKYIISAPAFLHEYTNGRGYNNRAAGTVGNSNITLVGESPQTNISVKNKFITDFYYNSGDLVPNNYGYPQYCGNVSIIYA